MNTIPQGGSQEEQPVPFNTASFEELLNGVHLKDFTHWLDIVRDQEKEIRESQDSRATRYRLRQFTNNSVRIGLLYNRAIPGVRRVSTDYAANAFQTVVTEPTLRALCQSAELYLSPVVHEDPSGDEEQESPIITPTPNKRKKK